MPADIAQYLPYLIPLFLLQVGLMVYALVDVIRRPTTRHLSRPVWFVIIILVNIIGPVTYLLVGRDE